jgi:two-component system nitrogen regulation sensor histidine kinase GlnL
MGKGFLSNFSGRLKGGASRIEGPVRNTLLIGFFILLLLLLIIGYWARASFDRLSSDIAAISDPGHLKIVLKISETFGQMEPEARAVFANQENSLMRIPAEQRLKRLKGEVDEQVEHGRKTKLSGTEEWKQFEAALNDFWTTVTSPEADAVTGRGDAAESTWNEKRDRVRAAIVRLEKHIEDERDKERGEWRAASDRARRTIGLTAGAALLVGFIVAALTLYESRRLLARLGSAYRESAERGDYLRSLLDSLVSGVVVLGDDGKVQTISQAFYKVTGSGGADSIGQGYEALFHDKPLLVENISKDLAEQSQSSRYYGRVELRQGRLFDVFASPLVIAEEQRGLILVFLDITESARAQAELRRNRALTAVGQMTAQIAHEIKNPLGSIRFAAELLKRRGAENGEEAETLQVIERSVNHLAAIVSELSEFARPKELNLTEVNLNELLDGLIPMVADRLTKKRVRIEKQFSQNIPLARYDGTELRKLFLNLIINAIDASHEGGTVKLKTHMNGGREIYVDVEDRGTGMDHETLRRLFEPFYTTKQTGTGLGMAIAKKIAELHRGDLNVVSHSGEGTKVTVRLPVE